MASPQPPVAPRRPRTTRHGQQEAADDRYLFYTRPDDAMRQHQVWRHEIGTPADGDVLVHQEDDRRFELGVGLTRSERYIVVEATSHTTSETHVLPADRPLDPLSVVEPRRQGHEYRLDHQGDRFLIVTNDGAPSFRVVEAPVSSPGAASWREVVPERPGVTVVDVDALARHVLVSERSEGLVRLRVLRAEGGERLVAQPEPVYEVHGAPNAEYDTSTYRFVYTSLTTPQQVTEVDLDTDERVVVKQQPVLGGYDPTGYETAREWAEAPDGTRVPVSLVWRRGLVRDGSAPCLLYGYGSYEASVPASFSSIRLNLLDRGFVFAIAHVRGGGELGRSWYEQGKLLSKRNTFTDFIACAEHLVAGGWTSPSRLAIRGASAGGLLVGAVVNMRPDLFAAAVAEVPFVDVVSSMSDPSLPLTVGEYEEWGNPEDPQYLAAMLEYSPYDNVTERAYPALYVTAGFNDPRVSYHEPAKWVAKLRALSTGERPILLRTELSAGHAGPSGRYEAWRDEARVQAFLLTTLGVETSA